MGSHADEMARALRSVREQPHAAGEVDATAARIDDGDPDSWVLEWLATAGAVRASAGDADDLLRAANYYGAALRLIGRSGDRGRRLDVWRRQRECWDRAVDRLGGERLAIPYGGGTLPGYFFSAAPGERRPLVIVNHGSVTLTSTTRVTGEAVAAARGHHWMTFDGPGQQAALVEQGLPARPDWEAVLTPVIDAMVDRGDVDPARIAVIGLGQGGFWVPRALAFEHRPAAAVADPGLVDIAEVWGWHLPEQLEALLRRGDRAAFERELRVGLLSAPTLAAVIEEHAAPYRAASLAGLFDALRDYRLGEEAAAIVTPLLVVDRGAPGQARRLFDALGGPKELVEDEGDGRRVADWIDGHLARAVAA